MMKNKIPQMCLLFSLILISNFSIAQQKQFINPDSLPPVSKNYTQAISVKGGRTVYVSGQVPTNAKGELVGHGDFRTQVKKAFDNLRTVLSAAKATPADVVKITIYVVNLNEEKLPVVREYLKDFVAAQPPTAILLGVQSLFNKEAMVEIEAIAVTQ